MLLPLFTKPKGLYLSLEKRDGMALNSGSPMKVLDVPVQVK